MKETLIRSYFSIENLPELDPIVIGSSVNVIRKGIDPTFPKGVLKKNGEVIGFKTEKLFKDSIDSILIRVLFIDIGEEHDFWREEIQLRLF